jgi:hypothetical protein
MLPDTFQSLVAAKEAAFLCKIAAARTSAKRCVVPLKFGLRKGAGPKSAQVLEQVGLGANRELRTFYNMYDGATLFASSVTGEYPLEIYALRSIAAKTRAMRRWFKINDLTELEEIEDPFALRTAVAVGGSPNSSSYLAVAVKGPYAGSVLQVDHGAPPDAPVASSFSALLSMAAEKPVEFLEAAAAYPRYSDGETSILWKPIAFSVAGLVAE